MAKYKPYDLTQTKMIPLSYADLKHAPHRSSGVVKHRTARVGSHGWCTGYAAMPTPRRLKTSSLDDLTFPHSRVRKEDGKPNFPTSSSSHGLNPTERY